MKHLLRAAVAAILLHATWGNAAEIPVGERLKTLEATRKAADADLVAARQAWSAEIGEQKKARADLAQSLLAHEQKRLRLQQELDALTATIVTREAELKALEVANRRQQDASQRLAEQLTLYHSEIPLQIQLPALATTNGTAVDSSAWATAFDRVHASGTALGVVEQSIRASSGESIDVKLLHAGHIAFAFHNPTSGRFGIAISSPTDAAGYRWLEALPPETKGELEVAFAAAANGQTVHLPMDVSGQLRGAVSSGTKSWQERFAAGGLVMYPLALVALVALILILERMLVLYREPTNRDRLMLDLLASCRDADWETATAACTKARGAVARTLSACLAKRSHGQRAMEDAIQEQLLHEVPRLRRFLSGIGILGAVAPLMGLLGTVTGIIRTFQVITVHGNPHPGMMANGISEALMTTAAGLVIAIPILLIHALFNGRVERVVSESERHAATLLNTIGQESK